MPLSSCSVRPCRDPHVEQCGPRGLDRSTSRRLSRSYASRFPRRWTRGR
ncbi:hypothetical protein [Ornithinimicrobium kibberense]